MLEQGPKPISQHQREQIKNLLSTSRVIGEGSFEALGTFGLVGLKERPDCDPVTTLWSSILLEKFEPISQRIKAGSDGVLRVYQAEQGSARYGNSIMTIDPGNLRIVDEMDSFSTLVPESGYLLQPSDTKHVLVGSQLMLREEAEQVLSQIDAGIVPSIIERDTQFLRVDPNNAGKKVKILYFYNGDAVVIDPVSRRRLERELVNPLAPKK